MHSLKRVIFIAGANHSGSTLMGCVLGASKEPFRHFHVGECYSWFRPEPKRNRASAFWTEIDNTASPHLAYSLLAEKSGAETIIDSSKNIRWLRLQAEVCRDNGIQLDIVVPYREMARLYHSTRRRVGDDSQKMRNRLVYYRTLARHLPEIAPNSVILVNTVEFCASPAENLKKLCDKLALSYFEGKERYWEFPSHHLNGAGRQQRHFLGLEPPGYEVAKPLPNDARKAAESYLDELGVGEAPGTILSACDESIVVKIAA